jgi:endonuclease/exonuclease/phosphatase family metal-dependent hydrolase
LPPLQKVVTTFLVAVVCFTAQSRAEQIRIVTFNTECLQAPNTRATRIPKFRWNDARQQHLEHVAGVIETLEPDVICLVEVTSKEAVDAVVAILHEKGLTQYRGYHVESADKFTGFDVAFVSRHKPDKIEGEPIRLVFSRSGDATWREKFSYVDYEGEKKERETGLMRHSVFCVTIGGRKLGFLGLHLKADPSDDYSNARRTAEATIALRIVNKEIVPRGYQPVILGDLNDYDPDVPDRDDFRKTATSVMRTLKDYDPKQAGPELINAAQKIKRVADRYTSHWDRNENGAVDRDDVFTMIDYVLLPKEMLPYIRRTFVSRLTGLEISDHWPVVVDLDLPAKQK